MQAQCEESLFHGYRSLVLRAGGYEAIVLPELGGNLISLRHVGRNYRFIRSPQADEMAEFARRPARFGVPVLFPPNRIDRGAFQFAGQRYRFPVNEPQHDNHIHGLFVGEPWPVTASGQIGGTAYAVMAQQVDERHPSYALFPHRYELRIRYEVGADGLRQIVTAVNRDDRAMPFMLGFHTCFRAPFSPGGSPGDCSLKVTIGQRWRVGERMLPTGELEPLAGEDRLMRAGGVSPVARRWADYYTAEPEDGRNYMRLTDHRERAELIYEVGSPFRNWVVWNDDGSGGFICVEPQTCAVNEINTPVPQERQGLIVLEPGRTWSAGSRMSVQFMRGVEP